MGAKRSLRVVIVEDSATDAELVIRELRKDGDHIELERVDSSSSLLAALERGPCDVVISDYHLPGFSGPDALQLVRSRNADVPFILVSGTIGEEIAVQMLKAGADDYLLKGNLTRLLPSVKARLQEAEERRARRRSEQELRASESLKGAILESSLDCIITMNHEGKIVEFNPAAEQTFGYRREQVLGRSMAELIIPPRLRDAHRRGLAHYLTTGEGPVLGKRLELEAIRGDGTEFPIELAITPINARSAPMFTGFIRDITQRRESEAKIKRLNRVYAVLSGINALIVRVRDREELYREACRIAVAWGNFRFAWVGAVDTDAMQLRPSAWAGDEQDYLAAVGSRLSLSEKDSQRRSLVARAAFEKEAMISNDVANDPRIAFKQEHAERGIRSLAAFPLMVSERVAGVFALHAAELGFFDDDELRLLRELAGDISFALENIDKHEKLHRLTRVNEMLSSINGAIVRIRDRLELYQEACRIAVETGGLRFAWLCVADEDEMRLKPVASAGGDDGYLDLIRGRLSLRDDAPEGHGMAAKAVRGKRALIVNDAQSDPNVLFKKEHAARGIRSMAVLPLSVGGKVVGTFGLHSGEVGFFDDQETKLIDEIAGNIAFALDHIEKEEKVERLNRVYAVLSGINGMIVRVRDRDELFREACRIAIELGQFRLVFIALVDEAAKQIRPIAWAGDHPELAQRPRPLGPSAPGREGTASQAVRSKLPVIENNVTAESRTLTYPEEVLKRGYRSVGSFPLVVGDKAVGVFGLFAGEPGYFDAEEVKLLQELAGDIAFALDHIEKEEKVRRLTRVQAVLSGINAAIVRIRDRQELFGESCRIAVEAGQFPLAWIGVVDRTDHRVKTAAWAGDERGFVQLGRPTVDAIGAGKTGLSAQAIDTRRPAICNDIEADGSAMRYAKEALERGYRSAAALPLSVDGTAIGALVLYAGEAGFFDDDEIKLLLELAGDISFALDHLEKAEKLNYLAYYDELTGLANSALFRERLAQDIVAAANAQRSFALVVVNVDRFRAINDAFGRQAGDELLRQIAERFAIAPGDSNRLARIGADHFAYVGATAQSEEDVARRTDRRLKHWFGSPYRVGANELRVSVTAGIAMFPNDGTDGEKLLKSAEAALKKAKGTGERYLFFEQRMTERIAENLSLENKLRQALEKDEFVLHYQPKVEFEKRAIVGVEALIRWQSPELGLVPPGKFIALLEETGLILEVGSWALTRAALDHRAWVEAGLKPPRIAVNVSAIQLRQRDFVNIVEQAVMEGMAPVAIDLEITESLIMENVEATIEKLKKARALGIKLAIDDFGTGYSSLAYLAKLPVETLKIDRSFVITMLNDPDTATMVQTMITLAHSLRLTVVAEGVDSEDQAKVLRLLRCDQMQGYLFSKPLPLDQMTALLKVRG
jgi:PAS domain S-box-containing protein/diguanylate cyclase (GGDEF)-like protein